MGFYQKSYFLTVSLPIIISIGASLGKIEAISNISYLHKSSLSHTFWRLPIKVLEGRDSRYKLLDLMTVEENEFHVLKPFVYEAALDVTRRDNMEYFIDS